jgi:hypothetical protein
MGDWHYRNIAIELSQRGYRKNEPVPSPRESPQVFTKVAAALRADGITKEAVADGLNIPVQEIEQLVFGLLVTGVTGGPGVRKATGQGGDRSFTP